MLLWMLFCCCCCCVVNAFSVVVVDVINAVDVNDVNVVCC
jgi:hypothetical protein